MCKEGSEYVRHDGLSGIVGDRAHWKEWKWLSENAVRRVNRDYEDCKVIGSENV